MATFPNPLSGLTPRPVKQATGENYFSIGSTASDISFFDGTTELPEVLEQEVERFGKRTVGGFLRMVGAEMPMASDRVVWSEQGRLHIAFENKTMTNAGVVSLASAAERDLFTEGMTVVVADSNGNEAKARVTNVATGSTYEITLSNYAALDFTALNGGSGGTVKFFVFGSEYAKGSGESGVSVEPVVTTFSNKPIILRDKYVVDASDMAQIGWIEVTTEAGASGYLWYMKAESEARLRFEDQLEMAMVEAEKADAASPLTPDNFPTAQNFDGMEGLFAAIEGRGIQYSGTDFDGAGGLSEFDDLLAELDKQGSIEENMLFLDRQKSLEIDNMLAAQNSYGAGGTSYGVFNNEEDMALNLGFSGFRRGSYDFYKTDWKYLNDSTTRGLIGGIEGVLVPAGTSSVYDEQLGQNISRPFLHVRYRANAQEDRRMKSWVTGSAGGNYTSAEDVMKVHYLSERTLCVQAANNFVLFK
jgi:hypothetical protein